MSYLKVFKQSAKLIWKNKFLLIFGFFISISAFLNSFNFKIKDVNVIFIKFKDAVSAQPIKILGFLFCFLIVFVLLVFFKQIGEIGLVKCANDIDAGRDHIDFRIGFKAGIEKFWKKMFFELIIGLFIFSVAIILGMPCIFLFVNNLIIPGFILSLLALMIFIPLSMVVSFINIYGVRYLVTENKGIIESLKWGGNLFLTNIKKSLITAFLMFVAYLSIISIVILALLIFSIPLVILWLLFYTVLKGIGKIIIMFLVLPFVLVVLFALAVFLKTFASVIWTLVFRQIK